MLRVAAQAGVPVMPRGGGTGLSGQTVNHAIVLDFTPQHEAACSRSTSRSGWARAQPGLVLAELNRQLARHGLLYGIDPSTQNRATIGGGVGNNSCGAHSRRLRQDDRPGHQPRRRALRRLAAHASSSARRRRAASQARPAGPRRQPLPRAAPHRPRAARRDRAALPQDHAPRLRLQPRRLRATTPAPWTSRACSSAPRAPSPWSRRPSCACSKLPKVKGLAAAHFRTLVEAAEATVAALEHPVSSIELIDSVVVERCRSSLGFHHLADFVQETPGGMLLIEMTGDTEAEVLSKIDRRSRPTSTARASATTPSSPPTPRCSATCGACARRVRA